MEKKSFDDIYQIVKLIPHGRVSTYGSIAEYLGHKGSARLVGWAMNASHAMPDVPAHRVVNRVGLLTGKHHFEEENKMQKLLEQEGIVIKDNQVQEFDRVFWNPCIELLY